MLNHKHGILAIGKPKGITSFDVVRFVKKKTGIKKIGHGGTLDPMAEGVLPILIGEGTAFFDPLLESGKIYKAGIQLGVTTDTDDIEGNVLQTFPVEHIILDDILQKIPALTGKILQIPPQYSALKVNGKRAYDLAREGISVELQAREIEVYSWKNIQYDSQKHTIQADIHCGSGTYIRSLARDLGQMLGIGACLNSLQRVLSGGVSIENAVSIENFPEQWEDYLISPEEAVSFLPAVSWIGKVSDLLNGIPLSAQNINPYPKENGLYRLMYNEKIVALLLMQNNKLSYRKNIARLYFS